MPRDPSFSPISAVPGRSGSAFEDERPGGARYLEALREHWLLIASLVSIAIAASAAYSRTAEKRYAARADILVTPIPAGDDTYIGIPLLRQADESRAVVTASRLIRTQEMAQEVKRRLGTDMSPGALRAAVEVRPQEQSSIVTIIATASTAEQAAAIANAFAHTVIDRRTEVFQQELKAVMDRLRASVAAIPPEQRRFGEAAEIERRLGVLGSLVGAKDPTLQIASEAVPPGAPVWPRPVLSVAVAYLAALLLGIGLAVALELINPRVNREDELLLEQRLPILARVPRMRTRLVRGYLAGREPLPADVREAYRTLRASLASAGRNGAFPQTILVTSAAPGEGKTMTAVNLAITLAVPGTRVLLVDGDLRRPMVSTFFRVAATRGGFAELLTGRADAEDVLVSAPGYGERLRLLPSSPGEAYLVDLLEPRRVEHVLSELGLLADVIVIDSPPLTEVADALTLADAVDTVLVAVRLGVSRRDKLNELRRMLSQTGVAPAGFVVTTRKRSRDYYYSSQEAQAPVGARAERRAPAIVKAQAKAEKL
jgi:capsular exopolysaccharide synthesis family protein